MIRVGLTLMAMHVVAAFGQSAAMDMVPLSPRPFATPDAAGQTLARAAKDSDLITLQATLGVEASRLLYSGDDVADAHSRRAFGAAYDQAHRLIPRGANTEILVVGNDEWPLPIPLVKHEGGWVFDAQAGEQEILRRRIGRNELAAIRVCKAIVLAEQQYATEHLDGDGVPVYTARLASSPGRHDGLYWPGTSAGMASPLGRLLATAEDEGYGKAEPLAPYHGYYYRILTRQGAAVDGGARDYFAHGKLRGGFAILAYPARYRASGVMSFMVDHNGTIYEKDLGQNTDEVVAPVTLFNPDSNWKKDEL